jgi:uncharacterized protein (DUF2062 family)
LFLLLAWFGWRTGSAIITAVDNSHHGGELLWAKQLAQVLQVSLIGYYFGGIFLGLAYFDLYYHLLTLLVLTQYLVNKQLDAMAQKNNKKPEIEQKSVVHHRVVI